MTCSLNSLKGGYIGDYIGLYRDYKDNGKDNGSYYFGFRV